MAGKEIIEHIFSNELAYYFPLVTTNGKCSHLIACWRRENFVRQDAIGSIQR
jgi:hypothetical protein